MKSKSTEIVSLEQLLADAAQEAAQHLIVAAQPIANAQALLAKREHYSERSWMSESQEEDLLPPPTAQDRAIFDEDSLDSNDVEQQDLVSLLHRIEEQGPLSGELDAISPDPRQRSDVFSLSEVRPLPSSSKDRQERLEDSLAFDDFKHLAASASSKKPNGSRSKETQPDVQVLPLQDTSSLVFHALGDLDSPAIEEESLQRKPSFPTTPPPRTTVERRQSSQSLASLASIDIQQLLEEDTSHALDRLLRSELMGENDATQESPLASPFAEKPYFTTHQENPFLDLSEPSAPSDTTPSSPFLPMHKGRPALPDEDPTPHTKSQTIAETRATSPQEMTPPISLEGEMFAAPKSTSKPVQTFPYTTPLPRSAAPTEPPIPSTPFEPSASSTPFVAQTKERKEPISPSQPELDLLEPISIGLYAEEAEIPTPPIKSPKKLSLSDDFFVKDFHPPSKLSRTLRWLGGGILLMAATFGTLYLLFPPPSSPTPLLTKKTLRPTPRITTQASPPLAPTIGRINDRPTDRPADRPTDRPADRPTDRPTDRPHY